MTWGKYFDPTDLKTFFRQVKATGADTVEFRPPDETILGDLAKTAEVRKMAEDMGIELLFCYGYPVGMDMRLADPFARQYAQEHLQRAIEAIARLGGTEIGGVLYANWPTDYSRDSITPEIKYERTQRCIESLRRVMPTAEKCNVMVNLEILNRFENYIINTVDEGLQMLADIGSDSCGLLLDMFHMSIEEDDIPAAIRKANGHIGQFHVSEPNRKIPFHNKRFNWPEIGRALRDVQYDKTVTMEAVFTFDDMATYNFRIWRDMIEDVSMEGRIEAMKNGILFLKEQFA
jgi:D-psicose/D-tagatose/L-ribulose 3-epimerase